MARTETCSSGGWLKAIPRYLRYLIYEGLYDVIRSKQNFKGLIRLVYS